MYEVTVGKHHLKTTITVENKGNKFFYVQFMHTILSHARVACSMRRNLLPGYSICLYNTGKVRLFMLTSRMVKPRYCHSTASAFSSQEITWVLMNF